MKPSSTKPKSGTHRTAGSSTKAEGRRPWSPPPGASMAEAFDRLSPADQEADRLRSLAIEIDEDVARLRGVMAYLESHWCGKENVDPVFNEARRAIAGLYFTTSHMYAKAMFTDDDDVAAEGGAR